MNVFTLKLTNKGDQEWAIIGEKNQTNQDDEVSWKSSEETVWGDEEVNYATCFWKISTENWSLNFAMRVVSVALKRAVSEDWWEQKPA